MKRRDFLTLAASAGIAARVARVSSQETTSLESTAHKRSEERVLDTRQLACGYISNGISLMVDPNTKKLSGLFYDLTKRMGELAGFDIQWTAETSFANFTEDLKIGKCDTIVAGIWPSARRASQVAFSLPTFYSAIGIYVRADDHRFDGNSAKLNDPAFRLATLDGEMSQTIQENDFAHASVLSLPDLEDVSMLAESVVTRKADATFLEKATAQHYMKHNPGALRNITETRPVRVFENTWPCAYGSERLRGILDVAAKEMAYSGYVDTVLAKYGQKDSVYPVRAPIQ